MVDELKRLRFWGLLHCIVDLVFTHRRNRALEEFGYRWSFLGDFDRGGLGVFRLLIDCLDWPYLVLTLRDGC